MTVPGDAAATFTCLFDTHRHAVHAYLLGRLGEPESARDLLQETFLRVWRRLPELRDLPAERQRAWIFAVARNLTIDTYRSRATRQAVDARLGAADQPRAPVGHQPEVRVEQAERVEQLAQAIRDLPEQLRVVLVLQTLGGLTSTEVGAALGEPPGTIRYRLSSARRRLATMLDDGERADNVDDVAAGRSEGGHT